MKNLITISLGLTALLFSLGLNAQESIRIAAAANLRYAMDSIVQQFSQINTSEVQVIYGSSGKLTEQIIHGAPFDLFFSADMSFPEKLQKENKTASEIYPYAKGRNAIWSMDLDPSKTGMQSLLDPSIVKISVANPTHAPYGMRAMESLEYYQLFDKVRSKLVYGDNISQAAQFVTSGAADIGIIALPLILSPPMKAKNGNYYIIPEESHNSLVQGAVITTHGKDSDLAKTFLDFMKSQQVLAVLDYFGYSIP